MRGRERVVSFEGGANWCPIHTRPTLSPLYSLKIPDERILKLYNGETVGRVVLVVGSGKEDWLHCSDMQEADLPPHFFLKKPS